MRYARYRIFAYTRSALYVFNPAAKPNQKYWHQNSGIPFFDSLNFTGTIGLFYLLFLSRLFGLSGLFSSCPAFSPPSGLLPAISLLLQAVIKNTINNLITKMSSLFTSETPLVSSIKPAFARLFANKNKPGFLLNQNRAYSYCFHLVSLFRKKFISLVLFPICRR
jgi:hypothetical protein